MKDGRTRQVPVSRSERRDGYLASHSVSLVFASGPLAGSEVALERPRITIGRAKTSEVLIDDASISHQHAALELGSGGYRIRDLGSTNGVVVNGARLALAELKHGDTVALGQIELRYVVGARSSTPKTHVVDAE
ncbi:MAG TPA: FHA domain-containing protein [Myxococcota bacterium]|nr:FHA domain-containing protein [Myxococcota bacterium]